MDSNGFQERKPTLIKSPPIRRSIATKMLKIVFSIYLVVAVSTTIIQMGVEYYSAKENLAKELNAYRNIFSLDLSSALWNFDREAITRISRGILEIPIIDGVIIADTRDNEVILSAGIIQDQIHAFPLDAQRYKFPILYLFQDKSIPVGTLILHSNPVLILKRLKASFTTLIINSLIKSLALFIIFLWVGRIILTRPLSILTSSMDTLNFEDMEECPPIDIKTSERNEFKLIEESFNRMVKRLISGINRRIQLQTALQRSNDQLERRIAERTRELSEKNRLLKHLSLTDPLTSAANRRHFDDTLNREYKRLDRGTTHLSLIFCDIDYFKTFNDLFGHQAGDECLKQVVRQLQAVVKRGNDCVARYGGEEFAIILPETPKQAAMELAERIRQAVEALGIPHEKPKGSPQVVTLSLGVACTDGQNGYDTALTAQADKALYQAKAKGRNRVES